MEIVDVQCIYLVYFQITIYSFRKISFDRNENLKTLTEFSNLNSVFVIVSSNLIVAHNLIISAGSMDDNQCRVCLDKANDSRLSVFKRVNGLAIEEKLHFITGIKVNK